MTSTNKTIQVHIEVLNNKLISRTINEDGNIRVIGLSKTQTIKEIDRAMKELGALRDVLEGSSILQCANCQLQSRCVSSRNGCKETYCDRCHFS